MTLNEREYDWQFAGYERNFLFNPDNRFPEKDIYYPSPNKVDNRV